MKVRLYSYWRSSASWRVRIALAYKGIAYEYVPVNILEKQQKAEDYVTRNPMAQVPTLEIDDGEIFRLTQSMAILDYLESIRPEPRLFPTEPARRARAVEIAEIVNSGIQPLQNLSVLQALKGLGGDPDAWSRERITQGLAAVEARLALGAKTWCVGDELSIADVFLVPQLYNARRFGVDVGSFPIAVAIEARASERPEFSAARPERQPDAPPA